MRVLVVSDTHAPYRWRAAPSALARALRSEPDLILHAGDVCVPDLLEGLSQYAPVRAVRGNNDGHDIVAWGATPVLTEEIDGVHVAMLHDAGVRAGRETRMRNRFGRADVVIFGHSHVPFNERSATTGQLLFNPGSPTDRRTQPFGTFGWLHIADGSVISSAVYRADA